MNTEDMLESIVEFVFALLSFSVLAVTFPLWVVPYLAYRIFKYGL